MVVTVTVPPAPPAVPLPPSAREALYSPAELLVVLAPPLPPPPPTDWAKMAGD